ncbi:cell wall-binding repeat-containing protein [Clostridium magnum]|uniref:Putative cell wall binding repeat 2 n=1 Tax=Clostridium magnum DSM 2767 TaxID=1121326 RepID=A0A162RWE7_9CLOT|nr:cell wall-binding repeat-containing protein [Clostridium magnum]KZL90463.1 putative cell wall binding repeat 2 [Clostridium magnum DSM 2767]SHH85824.1 Putative cell wall binding repeat 2 [Clostridium magnum DSM 2767]
MKIKLLMITCVLGTSLLVPRSISAKSNIIINRLAGQDRYETSVNVAKELGTSKGIFVVNGEHYKDALSSASIAVLSDNVVNVITGNTSASDNTVPSNAETNVIAGNLFIHSTSSDFITNAAGLDGVEISNNIGDGAVVLKSDTVKGVYTSNIINLRILLGCI